MQETITLTNLRVYAYHGVFEAEKVLGQPFFLSITASLAKPFKSLSDDITNTVSYADIASSATNFFQSKPFDLIEESAYLLSRQLLLEFKDLTEINVTVSKPHAPITLPFENVSVSTALKWTSAYLSIGSNQGDSIAIIDSAIKDLKENEAIKNIDVSTLIETAPWGKENQPNFINGAIKLDTILTPHELLKLLNELEAKYGRERKDKWGPRTLDIDIIYYGDDIIYTKDLIIPHYYRKDRLFVLEPLVELNPYLIDPLTKQTVEELVNTLKRSENLEV